MFKNFEKFRSKFRNISILLKNYSLVKFWKNFDFGQNFRKFSIIIKLRKKMSFFWSIFLKISIFVKVSKKKIDFGQIFQNIDFGIFEKMSNLVKISQNFTFSQIYRKNSILIKFGRNLRKISMFLFKNIRL